jgi:hypothetical protein
MTSRYLFPPMLKTMQLPTRLAAANSALTSPQVYHATLLWLTWLCQARSGPAESS